jgi:hypothetical protein
MPLYGHPDFTRRPPTVGVIPLCYKRSADLSVPFSGIVADVESLAEEDITRVVDHFTDLDAIERFVQACVAFNVSSREGFP